MTDYALPRVRTRRRKPWSPQTKFFLALTVFWACATFMAWVEIFAGHPIWHTLFPRSDALNGWDLLAAGIDPVFGVYNYREFRRSKERDER